MVKFYYALVASTSVLFRATSSFVVIPSHCHRLSSSRTVTFASKGDEDISIGACDNMEKAGKFMVDAFWLNSPQKLVLEDVTVTEEMKERLIEEQVADLEDKYGERLGKRTLDTTLLQITDGTGEILGLVGLEVSLLDTDVGDTISSTASEDWIKSSVASLGPKQRRLYKSAKVSKICEELMLPHLEAVPVLSNLVVSPTARRMGIAQKLCDATLKIARDDWKYDTIWLRVESENEAARTLYQQKLGFSKIYVLPDASGLRIGSEELEKVKVETLVMCKMIA